MSLPISCRRVMLSAVSLVPLSLTISFQAAAQQPLHEVVVLGTWEAGDQPGKRNRVTNDATGLPSGLSVITREELSTINVSGDISNVFRRVPGVVANSLGQGDTGNGFRMRGFATQGTHGADTAVYVDHVPQNMPSSEAGAGHGPAFLEWLTPAVIERIDVIKGPVSAMHGDQNRSGAVNIWTVDAAVPSQAALTVETYDGRRGAIVMSQDLGRLNSVFAVDIYRADSHRRNAWTDRDNLFWSLAGEFGSAHYSVRLNHYDSDFQAAGYLRYDQLSSGVVDRNDAEENALAPYGGGRRTALVFNRAPAGSEAGFYATAYIENFERVRGAAGGGVVHNVGSDDRKIMGGRVAYNLVFDQTAALHVGAELRRDDGTGIRRRYEDRLPTSRYLTYLDMDLYTYGVFAQAQYKPIESVKLLAGLRSDWFDYDIRNVKLPAASTDYRDSVVTPKAGVVWSASPKFDLFANVAQGFRSPAAQQISPAGSLGPLGAVGGTVNDNMSPSKVESYDAGFIVSPLEGWTAAATFFYTLNEDEIVQTAPNVFESVGDTTRKGVELEARAQFSRQFAAYTSYTRLLQAEINDAAPGAAHLISVPKHQAKAGAEFLHSLGRGVVRYNTDAYTTRGIPYFTGTPLQQRKAGTYVRYDLRASYDVGAFGLSAFAALQPHLISESFYATSAGLWLSPQPREHYGVSLRYSF